MNEFRFVKTGNTYEIWLGEEFIGFVRRVRSVWCGQYSLIRVSISGTRQQAAEVLQERRALHASQVRPCPVEQCHHPIRHHRATLLNATHVQVECLACGIRCEIPKAEL